MIDKSERKAWGALGKMPPELMGASHQLIQKFKDLAKLADEVSCMRWNDATIQKAKQIERDYYTLIEMAKAEKKKHAEKNI
jgi:hypothetical protein